MVLVTGATGFVGGTVMRHFDQAVACPSLRTASEDEIRRILDGSGADAIVHTAAISDTGLCQKYPDASYEANVLLPVRLSRAAPNLKLICFSSDQVYNGSPHEGPYTEADAFPSSVYASHKREMEERVLDITPDAVMLRAEWMFDFYTKKTNYFMNVLSAADSISVPSGQYRGLTYVKEVAENLPRLLSLPGGVYNLGSETTKSMYELTTGFLSAIGKSIRVETAPPRHNLWMDCRKARSFGISFSSVEEGLLRCAADHKIPIRQN